MRDYTSERQLISQFCMLRIRKDRGFVIELSGMIEKFKDFLIEYLIHHLTYENFNRFSKSGKNKSGGRSFFEIKDKFLNFLISRALPLTKTFRRDTVSLLNQQTRYFFFSPISDLEIYGSEFFIII